MLKCILYGSTSSSDDIDLLVAATCGAFGRPMYSVPPYAQYYLSYDGKKHAASSHEDAHAGIYIFGLPEPTQAQRDASLAPRDAPWVGYRNDDYQKQLEALGGCGAYSISPGMLTVFVAKLLTGRKVAYPETLASTPGIHYQITRNFTRTVPIYDGGWNTVTISKHSAPPQMVADVTMVNPPATEMPPLAQATKLLQDFTSTMRDANDTVAIASVGLLPISEAPLPPPPGRAEVQYAPLAIDEGLRDAVSTAPDPAQQEDIVAIVRTMLNVAVVGGPQGPAGPGFLYKDNITSWPARSWPSITFPSGDKGAGFCREFVGQRLQFSHAGDGLTGATQLPYPQRAGGSGLATTTSKVISDREILTRSFDAQLHAAELRASDASRVQELKHR